MVKGFPCRQGGIPTRGGDFHFQHGFYEMWVTKALNGDREQAQLFLAFGRGRDPGEIPNRTAHARATGRGWAGRRGLYWVPASCRWLERGVDSF